MVTGQLQQVTVQLLTENLFAIQKALRMDGSIRQICVDGKEQRGTGGRNNGANKVKNLQTLHVYDAISANKFLAGRLNIYDIELNVWLF